MRVEANKEYTFDDDQYLFKYIDLHRLIYFLNSKKLFFSPLSYFDDPLEGISHKVLYERHTDDYPTDQTPEEKRQNQNKIFKVDEKRPHYSNYLEKVQSKLFASCWFLGVRESLAMWETYSNNDSVALRFRPRELCNTMINRFSKLDEKDFSLMVHGKVEYFKLSPFDPNDEDLKNSGHRFAGFIKDLSYKHEEEFRFLLMQKNLKKEYAFYEFCPGSLQQMQFDVITHPYMENWKFNNISNILKNNRLQDRLTKSEILTRRQVFQTKEKPGK